MGNAQLVDDMGLNAARQHPEAARRDNLAMLQIDDMCADLVHLGVIQLDEHMGVPGIDDPHDVPYEHSHEHEQPYGHAGPDAVQLLRTLDGRAELWLLYDLHDQRHRLYLRCSRRQADHLRGRDCNCKRRRGRQWHWLRGQYGHQRFANLGVQFAGHPLPINDQHRLASPTSLDSGPSALEHRAGAPSEVLNPEKLDSACDLRRLT